MSISSLVSSDAIPIVAVAAGLPFLLVASTAFAKLAIVISALRYALGTPRMPPNAVVLGIAMVLTIHVMWPVVSAAAAGYERAGPDVSARAAAVAGPLAVFVRKNAREKDAALFREMREKAAEKAGQPALSGPLADGLSVYAPAFVLTELTEAFLAAFLICVPFLVLDLVVSSTLLAAGAHMLSPTVISLPLKLLLFVLMDGWTMIVKGLVVGYVY